MINEDQLLKDLNTWFDYHNLAKSSFWERNKVAKLIKDNMRQIGKWKYRARGNPRKGYLKMKEKSTNNGIDF